MGSLDIANVQKQSISIQVRVKGQNEVEEVTKNNTKIIPPITTAVAMERLGFRITSIPILEGNVSITHDRNVALVQNGRVRNGRKKGRTVVHPL